MTEQKILWVNACVRKNSRTRFLAEQVIRQLHGTVVETNPAAVTAPITTEEFIIRRAEATDRKANNEKAQELLDKGISDAQQVIQDPSKMDEILAQFEDKLSKHPTIRKTLSDIPLMIEMLKAWEIKEYTEVSPEVVTRLVSAILYLTKEHDLLWDNIPVVGMADDLAVMGLALRKSKADLKAFSEWKDEHNGAQA